MKLSLQFVSLLYWVAAAFASATPSPDARPFHLIILSGQTMNGVDPKTGFEAEAKERFAPDDVLYFKIAKGGSPIRLWVAEWNEIAARHGVNVQAVRAKDTTQGTLHYEPILAEHHKLVEGRGTPASVTFCWMQGEQDGRDKLDAPYAEALKQLIFNLRRDLKQPDMNVVIGRLNDWGEGNHASWHNVRQAHMDIAASDPHAAWVDTDDLNDKEVDGFMQNQYHFTGAGCALLGRRFARQSNLLVRRNGQAKDGRPQ